MNLFEMFFRKATIKKDLIQEPLIAKSETTEFSLDMPSNYLGFIQGGKAKAEDASEKSYIQIYREMSEDPEVDDAIEEIANETIVVDENENSQVELDLEGCKSFNKTIKKRIIEEYDEILRLLDFKRKSHLYFRDWYVDGVEHFEVVFEKNNIKKGIIKLNWLDPLQLEKIEEIENPLDKNSKRKVYYRYTPNGQNGELIIVDPSLVVSVTSGYKPKKYNVETSYLFKSIKALNNLRNVEDSIIIARLTTSAEKKVFNVDVGMLQKAKADDYLAKLVNKFNNKLVYNTTTGKINSEKNLMAMFESYWFPKSADGKGTSVDLLSPGKSFAELDDLYYWINKLWKSLGVPESRRPRNVDSQPMFETGRSTQIARDEIIFYKRILKIRTKYSELFYDLLRRQLIAKEVMKATDFDKEKENIKFVFNSDNYYDEIKTSDIYKMRFETLTMAEPFIGKFITKDQAAYDILKYTEEQWKEIQEKLKEPENAEYQQSGAGFGGGFEPEEKPETPFEPYPKNQDDQDKTDTKDDKSLENRELV